jgi:nucleoside-triphosphatase THEP1
MTGKKVPFARLKYFPRGISVGRYSIQPAGISHGLEAINRAIEAERLVIIDEVGPMEVQGLGFYSGVQKALIGISDVLLVVRPSQKREVLNRFCVGPYIPLNIKTDVTAQWQRIANYNSNKCI